jgi:D-alanyl-D-alanine carboxypeptidase
MYRSYYNDRRNARIRFLAGVGTFFMIFAAVIFVAFAVFSILGITVPIPRTNIVPAFGTQNDTYYVSDAVLETTSWLQAIMPPREGVSDETFITSETEIMPIITSVPTPSPTPRPPAPPIPVQFHALPFYMSENSVPYADFQQDRPDLPTETIIWMVNSTAYLPRYSNIRMNRDENPLLLTPNLRLPNGFVPYELVPVNDDECYLRATPETVEAFHSLRAAAQEEELDLLATSAYRTSQRQSELWENGGRRDGSVARAHHSEHQTGRAIDLWGPGGLLDAREPSPTGRWVAANAHNHGFIIRYRAETTHITGYIHEPWHITYVGMGISMYMYENNILSLEEFVGRNPDWSFYGESTS